MKQFLLFITICLSLASCKENVTADDKEVENTTEEKQSESNNQTSDTTTVETVESNTQTDLKTPKGDIDVIDGMYYEYYPGIGKKVKFKGKQDENGKRDGKWLYFSEDGTELSVTNYTHGKRNGMSIVKYPNGNLHYTGEYKDDKTVGVWRTYSLEGVKLSEKDYGNGQ